MKPNREDFQSFEDDWVHTEVLSKKGGRSNTFSNMIIGGVAILLVVLVVLAFTNLFKKDDLSNLENLDQIKKEKPAENKLADEGALEAKRAEEEAKRAEEEQKAAEAAQVKYKVKSGDTLASIGAEFGVEYTKIAEANGLKEPFAIEIDQELIIPGAKKVEEKPQQEATEAPASSTDSGQAAESGIKDSGQTYTVKSGDTLAGIAATLGVDWQQMAQLNGMSDPYPIEIDQVLKVPAK